MLPCLVPAALVDAPVFPSEDVLVFLADLLRPSSAALVFPSEDVLVSLVDLLRASFFVLRLARQGTEACSNEFILVFHLLNPNFIGRN